MSALATCHQLLTDGICMNSSSDPSRLPAYDHDRAVQVAGGNPKIAADLLTLFIDDLAGQRQALTAAYQSGDYSTLRAVTHKLHGSASYCGTPAVQTAAATLERLLTEPAEQASIESAYQQLMAEIDRLETAYQSGELTP